MHIYQNNIQLEIMVKGYGNPRLQDVSWCSDGTNFMLAHADGGYSKWNSQEGYGNPILQYPILIVYYRNFIHYSISFYSNYSL